MSPKENIIVTGGAGYIGSHICKMLNRQGFQPVTLDNLTGGFKELVKWGPLEIGNITDKNWLIEIFKKYSPLAVIHCAGLISVEESVRLPDIYFHNNFYATEILLQAMQKAKINHLIYSSTASVYGNTTICPIAEVQPCMPQNPYAESKFSSEKAIAQQVENYGMSGVILRYFNAAGADAEGETGELHQPETHLIPLAILAALNETEFTLYGDGSIIRDYVHVTDIANAHLLALKYSISQKGLQTFNIGTGNGFAVSEVLKTIEQLSGCKLKLKLTANRAGDIAMLVADTTKAKNILGYQPNHSSLNNIIKSAINWHQRNHPFLGN